MSKKIFQERSDYDSPEYKQWRYSVMSKDHFKCVKCGSQKSLQAHHILRWADYPKLRYLISNGVTLCEICHDLVTGNEDRYIDEFRNIVAMRKNAAGFKTRGKKYMNKKYRPPNPYMRF
jgi:5-methylcytosine-specific restriction endonuclease McrA